MKIKKFIGYMIDRVENRDFYQMLAIQELLIKSRKNKYDYKLFKKAFRKYKKLFFAYWKDRYDEEEYIFFKSNHEYSIKNFFKFKAKFSKLEFDIFYCSDRLGDNERILRIADQFMQLNTYFNN